VVRIYGVSDCEVTGECHYQDKHYQGGVDHGASYELLDLLRILVLEYLQLLLIINYDIRSYFYWLLKEISLAVIKGQLIAMVLLG
jgi:hypothetical protein